MSSRDIRSTGVSQRNQIDLLRGSSALSSHDHLFGLLDSAGKDVTEYNKDNRQKLSCKGKNVSSSRKTQE